MRSWPTSFLLCALVVACTRPDVPDPLDAPIVLEQPPTVAVDWRAVGPIDFQPRKRVPFMCGTYYRDHDDLADFLNAVSPLQLTAELAPLDHFTVPLLPVADTVPSLSDPTPPPDTRSVLSPAPEAPDTLPSP